VDWEQVLAEFHRLIGRRVLVSVSPLDPDPDNRPGPSMLSVDGVLAKGEPSRAQEIIRMMGKEQPDEEALTFTVAPDALLTLTHSRFVEAGRSGIGSNFYVVQGDAMVQVSDWEEGRQIAARLPAMDQ
jgi:hypothetical protein